MGYKIVIPAIAIVFVLFTSGLALDVLAHQGDNYNENKRVLMMKFSGNFGSCGFMGVGCTHSMEWLKTIIDNNEGSTHHSAWNKMHYPVPQVGISYPSDCPSVFDKRDCDWEPDAAKAFADAHFARHGDDAKLLLVGFSFGGGAATFAADKIDESHKVEALYLVDPVGPGAGVLGSRLGIEKHCNISYPQDGGCNNSKPWRTLNSNVKGVYIGYQRSAAPPDDIGNLFDDWEPHISGTFYQNGIHCKKNLFDCHNQVGGNGGTDLQKAHFLYFLTKINKEPSLSFDSEINEFDVLEGKPLNLVIHSEDDAGHLEDKNSMDLDVRVDSLSTGIEPTQHVESNTGDGIQATSNFDLDLTGLDGPSTINRTAWVQDNGWPCNDCTLHQDSNTGATGWWNSANFTINMINAPPTVGLELDYFMQQLEVNLPLLTTDPSNADTAAGFTYEIDWGDGTFLPPTHGDAAQLFTHEYTQSGIYNVVVTATDKDGGVSEEFHLNVATPFVQLPDDFDDLVNDGILNKGQGNSFNSKINAILKDIDKHRWTPACNVADALINEVNAFVNSGKLTAEQGAVLIEEIEKQKDAIFCNGEPEEELFSELTRKGGKSISTNNAHQARFFSLPGNSNPSSPQTSDDLTDDDKGGGGDEHLTRPTFGISHETFETIVDSGFRFNDQSFTINDNHHTPFAQQTVNIGEVNTFEAKIYADKRLKVQEFLFGIPNVGEAHLAELGVEVWYDYNGNIEDVKAVQKSNIIDKETLVATHEKVKCQASDPDERCDLTNVSMVFLEPLKDKVMAVKAIDYKQRYQITYLNEGVDIAGESLNPMQTYLIPSNVRDGGLIKVTQLEKYSPYWQTDDGRMFEMNSFGSFKEVNQKFERFQDTGTAYTRLHSGFGGVMNYELKRATEIFDGSELLKELPDFIPYTPPEISDRMTDDMKAKMQEQEEIAKEILEKSRVQARW
jgi:hypothetical protein